MISEEKLRAMFSPAERLVLRELATGATNKMIARTLNIAEGTVKVHLKAIQKKTGTSNRTQTVVHLFYYTYQEQRDAEAMAVEFSGKLTLVTWNDQDHTAHREVPHGGEAPMPVGGNVPQRRQVAAE